MEKYTSSLAALKAWLQQIGCAPLVLRNRTAVLLADQGLLLPAAILSYFRVTDRGQAAELKLAAGHLVLISTASAFLDHPTIEDGSGSDEEAGGQGGEDSEDREDREPKEGQKQ